MIKKQKKELQITLNNAEDGNKEVTYADTKVDGVHYNENGAKWVASQIMRLAYESGSTIKNYINEPDVFDIPMIVLDK